jgi:hypothetical protein
MTRARELAKVSTAYETGGAFGHRNKIINGCMRINQRALGSLNPDNGAYSIDRWQAGVDVTGKITVNHSSNAPTGFTNSFIVTSSSAYTAGTNEAFNIRQVIEGFNSADLAWGTADAKPVTLSFWVKSSLTGNFGGSFVNNGYNRSYPFIYAISSANTWEYKTITIAGDTSGSWDGATNSAGIRVLFGLGAGSGKSGTANTWAGAFYNQPTSTTSIVGTSGATWQITGVQLEAGRVATPFEMRSYGLEDVLCKRYAVVYNSNDSNAANRLGFGIATTTTKAYCPIKHPVTMRAKPSLSYSGAISVSDAAAGTGVTSLATQGVTSDVNQTNIDVTVASGLTAYRSYFLEFGGTATLTLSSEL